MKSIVLLVAALTLAPVAGLAADRIGGAKSTASSTLCLLDPASCSMVERSKFRR